MKAINIFILKHLKLSLLTTLFGLVSFSAIAQESIFLQAKNPVANQQIICASNQRLTCYQLKNGKKLWENTSINDSRGMILNEDTLFLTQHNTTALRYLMLKMDYCCIHTHKLAPYLTPFT